MKSEHYPISIRFPEQTKSNLEREAEREERSISYIVRRIVERHFEQQKRRGAA